MREVRAVVIGVFVVLVVLLGINAWRRPGREYRHVRGYRVEIRKTDDGRPRHIAFTVPMNALARLASFAPFSDIGGHMKSEWGDGELTARDILDAADQSKPGAPGVLTRGHNHIEVQTDGNALDIQVRDDWDKTVRIRLPRSLVETFTKDSRISPRDILHRLDDLGPGDVVSVHDRDGDVTITAQAR